jgi:hypothetical protein
MITIKFSFRNGLIGTLTHHDPEQIREWIRIFDNPEARTHCGIVDISVENAYSEAA